MTAALLVYLAVTLLAWPVARCYIRGWLLALLLAAQWPVVLVALVWCWMTRP